MLLCTALINVLKCFVGFPCQLDRIPRQLGRQGYVRGLSPCSRHLARGRGPAPRTKQHVGEPLPLNSVSGTEPCRPSPTVSSAPRNPTQLASAASPMTWGCATYVAQVDQRRTTWPAPRDTAETTFDSRASWLKVAARNTAWFHTCNGSSRHGRPTSPKPRPMGQGSNRMISSGFFSTKEQPATVVG